MKTNFTIIVLISLLLGAAQAQEAAAPGPAAPTAASTPKIMRPVKKGKVSVTFDDELVKGDTMLPEGDVISSRLDNRFKRFIKVRKDFIQDVENTKDEFGHK
ncbi:hypothetical protein AZI86_00170 [Bdellovibrio bacteriovorus]|uniref:Uncharacterized protein n=1 Tax=Bdellovibrio bacteriovorus TaxID=959 RepID=A0A150WM93_BDEBC|nr:hypothetical protein [Bdellovibrio bacteriovorus]KYG65530.1 hypothetical protein AZI86_00170 [Bdellovibrio bacteriovorus]